MLYEMIAVVRTLPLFQKNSAYQARSAWANGIPLTKSKSTFPNPNAP